MLVAVLLVDFVVVVLFVVPFVVHYDVVCCTCIVDDDNIMMMINNSMIGLVHAYCNNSIAIVYAVSELYGRMDVSNMTHEGQGFNDVGFGRVGIPINPMTGKASGAICWIQPSRFSFAGPFRGTYALSNCMRNSWWSVGVQRPLKPNLLYIFWHHICQQDVTYALAGYRLEPLQSRPE